MAQIVTITNPLTGQPAQVDQLDHTAQEIDDAIARALPGGEIDITLQQITGATNAAEYSATATYAIGDYCTHDGKLYRCTTAITEAEAWTEAHWTETTVGAELTAIDITLQNKADKDRVVNPNLLDNPYFGNPVDQRGGYVVPPATPVYNSIGGTQVGTTDTYYTVIRDAVSLSWGAVSIGGSTYYVDWAYAVRGYTGSGYGIDRWFLSNADGSVLVEDTGVRLTVTNTCSFVQSLPLSLAGETVTLSVLAEDVSGPAYLSLRAENFGWMEDGSRVNIQTGLTTLTFTVASSRTANKKVCISNIDDTSQVSVKIKAVKLELGTQQTLAHQENGVWVLNEIPDYGEQLARCQRYFQTFATESLRPTNALDFRPVMRATPALSTITVGGKTLYTASADL